MLLPLRIYVTAYRCSLHQQEKQRQCTNYTAVALRDRPAESTYNQRQQPTYSPHNNINSAALSEPSACHFGKQYAIRENIANVLQDHLPQLALL